MFVINKNIEYTGCGLLMELPFLTSDRMVKLFGRDAGMKTQRKEKYSRRIAVQNQNTGEGFDLYMCFGVWRIGGQAIVSSLGELMEFLCPIEYQGYGLLSQSAIVACCKCGIPITAETGNL